MNIGLRILGLVAPVALPLIGIWAQQRLAIFQAPEIDIVIPVGFLLAGIVTGALLRAWWSITYIFVLAAALTILILTVTDEYPGSDSDAITLAFIIAPIMMLGAVLGTLLGKVIERR